MLLIILFSCLVAAVIAIALFLAPLVASKDVTRLWDELAPYTAGSWLFMKIFGFVNPYAGGLGASVEILDDTKCTLSVRQRRAIQGPFGSLHLAALLNLAESAAALYMTYNLPKGTRLIPFRANADFLKKAKGRVLATCTSEELPSQTGDHQVLCHISVNDGKENGSVYAQFDINFKVSLQ